MDYNGLNRTMDSSAVNVHLLWSWSPPDRCRIPRIQRIGLYSNPLFSAVKWSTVGWRGFYIWWERVWSMKPALASNWAAMRRGSEIGNFNDSRAIAASRSHRFFFFFFVSRPSRKSRTKIRPGTDRELNVRFSDACRCANKRWSPVVPREAEAAVLHVVEFELITTISRGPSKLWGGRGGGRGIVHGIVNRYSVAITFT